MNPIGFHPVDPVHPVQYGCCRASRGAAWTAPTSTAPTLRHFFAPVADLLYDDESVTEVLINGPGPDLLRAGRPARATDRRFADAAALEAAVRNLAEYVDRRLDDDHHSMDARLPEPEQFRVHVIIPPASRQGVCVSIRKFQQVDRDARRGWSRRVADRRRRPSTCG